MDRSRLIGCVLYACRQVISAVLAASFYRCPFPTVQVLVGDEIFRDLLPVLGPALAGALRGIIGAFVAVPAYSAGGQRGQQVTEFKEMIKGLHAAGLEVDNRAYYRLVDEDPVHYYDTTGTGNSLNMRHPRVAYCQDNDISWVNWKDADHTLAEFTRLLLALRAAHPVFRRRRFFQGQELHGSDTSDIAWFRADGSEMGEQDWDSGFAKSIGVFLNGQGITGTDRDGEQITDDSFLLLFNTHHEPLAFTLPTAVGQQWERVRRQPTKAQPWYSPGIVGANRVSIEYVRTRRSRLARAYWMVMV